MCLPTHQLESLSIDPGLSASWEIVSLQLAEVSQKGHFFQAVWKQKLCDLMSLSDTSDRREKNWCLSDSSGKVQMILFMISSLKRKTLKPLETRSCLLQVPVKHKNIKWKWGQVPGMTWFSVFSDYWDKADGTTVSEGLPCNPCFTSTPSLQFLLSHFSFPRTASLCI